MIVQTDLVLFLFPLNIQTVNIFEKVYVFVDMYIWISLMARLKELWFTRVPCRGEIWVLMIDQILK